MSLKRLEENNVLILAQDIVEFTTEITSAPNYSFINSYCNSRTTKHLHLCYPDKLTDIQKCASTFLHGTMCWVKYYMCPHSTFFLFKLSYLPNTCVKFKHKWDWIVLVCCHFFEKYFSFHYFKPPKSPLMIGEFFSLSHYAFAQKIFVDAPKGHKF